MTSFRLIPVEPAHLPELGRIVHDAFGSLHDRHNVPRDFPDVETAVHVLTLLANRPDYIGVAAVAPNGSGERLIGSNFLQLADSVAGLGPITVDPHVQAKGVGRALMKHIIGEAQQRGRREVRLFQETINTTSLPLYTSVGFGWVDSGALMTLPTVEPKQDDGHFRAMTRDDVQAVGALSERCHGFSRAEDAGILLGAGFPGFVRERAGKVVAYWFPSLLGHGAADSVDDLVALIIAASPEVPPQFARFICPLSEVALFRSLLAAGCRVLKMLSYMSWGECYKAPTGVWLPSIQC